MSNYVVFTAFRNAWVLLQTCVRTLSSKHVSNPIIVCLITERQLATQSDYVCLTHRGVCSDPRKFTGVT